MTWKVSLRSRLFATASIGGLCLTMFAPQAQAQTYSFNIPEESLSVSLREYGRVSGQEIIFTNDLVQGYTSRPLRGSFNAGDALRELLLGTGLSVEHTDMGVLMIRRDSRAADGGSGVTAEPVRMLVAQAGPPPAPLPPAPQAPEENQRPS